MYPFTGFYVNQRTGLCEGFDLFRENPGRIDDITRARDEALVAQVIAHMRAAHLAIFGNKRGDFGVVSDGSAILNGGTQDSHRQARIVGLPIVVDKALLEVFSDQGRRKLHDFFATQAAVSLDIVSPGQAIVKPESNIKNNTKPDTSGSRKGD